MTAPIPVPVIPPEAVTPRWLTAALRASGAVSSATVTAVERQRVGTGLVGQNVRFSLSYDRHEPGAPASVVGKFPSSEPVSRATGVAGGIYEREVRFYREVAPTVRLRTPRCYVAEFEPHSGDFVLLLEDLAPARPGDQIAGCTITEAALALTELAGLHAPRWDDPALAALAWLPRATPAAAQRRQDLYQALWPRFLQSYEHTLPPGGVALGERYGHVIARWLTAGNGPLSVFHGDYRIDNMMFGTEDGGYPVAVVDWQTVSLGAGAWDAAYFLGAGPLVDARRAHERDLLRRYHDALREGGVQDYTWDACWADYRRGALHGLWMSVVSPMVVDTDARGFEMFAAMASRHFTHALDLDAMEVT